MLEHQWTKIDYTCPCKKKTIYFQISSLPQRNFVIYFSGSCLPHQSKVGITQRKLERRVLEEEATTEQSDMPQSPLEPTDGQGSVKYSGYLFSFLYQISYMLGFQEQTSEYNSCTCFSYPAEVNVVSFSCVLTGHRFKQLAELDIDQDFSFVLSNVKLSSPFKKINHSI